MAAIDTYQHNILERYYCHTRVKEARARQAVLAFEKREVQTMTVIMPLKDQTAAKLYQNNLAGEGGHYLLGANKHWHGGMHFTIDKPVQAIADGKLIAYRLEKDYLTADLRHSGNNPKNKYSNSFALIKHECTVKGRTLNYYSLYMHLMPASGYKAKPKMAIPDFIRAMEGSDKDAVIQVKEKQIDIPGGLRIRHLKTGDILTVAPIGSEVKLDNNIYSEAEQTRYTMNFARNADYKKVTFIDHKEKVHNGYALLDAAFARQEDDHYTIIFQEDALLSGDVNALKGLKLRSKQNYDDKTIIKIIKNGTKVKIKIIDTQWAEVKEIDGTAPIGDAFIYHKNRVKFDENDIDEALLGKVHSLNQKITAGDLLGNPGLNFSQNNCLHFEIFSDDSIVDFIEDHTDLSDNDKTILQVNKGSKLFQRKKVEVAKATAVIKKYSRIKIKDTDANSEYVKITATGVGSLVVSSDMKDYDKDSEQYKGIKENLEKYKAQISNELNESTRLDFIYYANAAGDVTSRAVPGHRLVAYPIAATDQKAYWVKRDLINSKDVTTDDKDKGTILFNSLNMLYKENPIEFIFQEESVLGSSDDSLVDFTTCKSCKDADGATWYEAKLPFDDKGVLHYLSLRFGVNRTAQKSGWVKASDCVLTSPLNWPGFKLTKETEGKGSGYSKIDFENLSSFFKELFEDIDTNGDGAINARELKAALRDDILSERLSRIIAKHPSEWYVDGSFSKWDHLKKMVPDEAAFEETKKLIKSLAWWDDALCSGGDLPTTPEIYHLHPVSFIEQLNSIGVSLPIDYDKIYAKKGPEYKDSQIVDYSYYNVKIDKTEGRFAGNSRVSGDAKKNVQRKVIDTLFTLARKNKFSNRDICLLLAMARLESGYNPDAAAGTTSAAGIGQFIKKTGAVFGLNSNNVFNIKENSEAFIGLFKENARRADKKGLKGKEREVRIYAVHHDGPALGGKGEGLAKSKVMPWLEKIYKSISWEELG